jgi:acetylglutamate kinase
MNLSPPGKPIVIKIGGSTLGSQDTTLEDLVGLQQQGGAPVVVHGGGKLITQWLSRQDVPTRFVRGQRVTDAPTLEVVVAVLAGVVNKEIVAALTSLGGRAVGLSGVDGQFIQAKIKDAELGYVGEIVKVEREFLERVLQAGYIPVVAPIGLDCSAPGSPRLLNINADTAAGELALALGAERLIFLTDVPGVCDPQGNSFPRLSPAEAQELIASGVISGGMIPKIEACLRALPVVPVTRILDGRVPHALRDELKGGGGGTTIA